VNPESLGVPRGWNHGILAPPGGRLLFVAGQVGWEESAPGEPPGFVEQFARALDKVLAVVKAAGGGPDDLARLTVYVTDLGLYRPERLNALTFEVYAELRDAFRALDTEPGVRAIVLTGAGRGFCSGGDVEDIIGALFGRDAAGLLEFTRMTCDLILNLRRCRRPVVAAVNGTAAGAGAVIAAACDFRVAAESARIAFLFVRVGLSGADMGASWLLPRLVGLGRATDLLMTGDFID